MDNTKIGSVEEKVRNRLGISQEEFNKFIDKKFVTAPGKDGEELYMFRNFVTTEVAPGQYTNKGKYMVFNSNGEYVAWLEAFVENTKTANSVEIEYLTNEEHRGKGIIHVGLDKVLEDIFVDSSYDDLTVKTIFPKTKIESVSLAISKENEASKRVAQKSGFTLNEKTGAYQITKTEFLKQKGILANKQRKEDLDEI